ncbi:MAG: hypothetical protein OXI75_13725 [Rhodospirillales bacterium]|nr:hypothetical protein [Rhodospirillales bacterium]
MNKICLVALLLLLSLQGCANINTVDRTTPLPYDKDKHGIAIHLDAKQRLVLAKPFGTVCAEPSPDALSTFVASLSGRAESQGDITASLATAISSTAVGYGLRTQSVTLMRDALYRICEAYYGKALTGPAVMTLLAQSQNLTAAILAIEQLTGPVIANQTASIGAAKGISDTHTPQRSDPQPDAAIQGESGVAKSSGSFSETASEETMTEGAVVAQQPAGESQGDLNRATIPQSRASVQVRSGDSAAGGRVQRQRSPLAGQKAQELNSTVALAVKEIVTEVIRRSYVQEACIALIADNPPRASNFGSNIADYNDALAAWKTARDFCKKQLEK